MRSTYQDAMRARVIVEMAAEDGATPAGEIPPDHAQAVLAARGKVEIDDVARAHREGREPPDHVGPKEGTPP